MAQSVKPSMGCGYVVSAFLVGFGLLALWGAQVAYRDGQSTTSVLATAVFGIITAAAGLAILRPMRRAVQRHDERQRLEAAHPNEPWLWRPEWRGPAIESRDGAGAWMIWAFTLFWNAVSFPVAIAVLVSPDVERGAYLVLLFPLIGLFLLWAAMHKTLQLRKFGRPRFLPSTMPGAIGGYLGGVIEVPVRVAIDADARLSLKCIRRITTGSGKNRSTRETVLWEREERIPRDKWTTDIRGTEIPVLFHIPADSEPSDNANADNQLLWTLSAAAEVPGVDFECNFEVPVFFSGETAAPPETDRPMLDVYTTAAPDDAALRGVGVTRAPGRFHFSSSHLTGSRIAFSAVTLVLFGIGIAFWNADVPVIVWLIVGFLALIFGLLAIDLWFGTHELVIEGQDVVVRRRGLWKSTETRIPRAEVDRTELSSSMTAGSVHYFRLKLLGRPGLDPATPGAGENFQARKQRHRLRRLAKQLGVDDPTHTEPGRRLLEAMARTPRFSIEYAKHIPGRATAESIANLVLSEIKK